MFKKLIGLIVAGFFIVLPLVLIYFVLADMIGILGGMLLPIADMMPIQEMLGIYIADILAILLICLLF